jgi:hypothetical protein
MLVLILIPAYKSCMPCPLPTFTAHSDLTFPSDKSGGTSQFVRSVYRDGELFQHLPRDHLIKTICGIGIVYYVYLFGKLTGTSIWDVN